MFDRIKFAFKTIRLKEAGISFGACPLCKSPLFFKLNNSEMGIRCLGCRATPPAMAVGAALKTIAPDLGEKHIYELSSRGPLFNYLSKKAGALTCSEFFEDLPKGEYLKGVQCQDVQSLTFDDRSFDICTCTEVFEHVPDDIPGFSEIHRVLKPEGVLVFTVPVHNRPTAERAVVEDGKVKHILPPFYHDDHLRGRQKVLCFRDYGNDILGRLKKAGFKEARFMDMEDFTGTGFTRPAIVAYKRIGNREQGAGFRA